MSIIIVGVGPAEFDGKSRICWTNWISSKHYSWLGLIICQYFLSYLNLLTVILIPFPAAMVELDGDEVRISSRGRYAERDIVQVRCLSVFTLKALMKFIHLWVCVTFLSFPKQSCFLQGGFLSTFPD